MEGERVHCVCSQNGGAHYSRLNVKDSSKKHLGRWREERLCKTCKLTKFSHKFNEIGIKGRV